jgi:hypothetical protein
MLKYPKSLNAKIIIKFKFKKIEDTVQRNIKICTYRIIFFYVELFIYL